MGVLELLWLLLTTVLVSVRPRQNLVLEGKQRRFAAGADVDLAIDVFKVMPDGVLADG